MLELQREMEEQEEKDKDFSLLQRLAEEEVRQEQFFRALFRVGGPERKMIFAFIKADTVKSLEKENMKLIEAIGDMEQATREDKQKMESMEENIAKEREKVREQINKTVNEVW